MSALAPALRGRDAQWFGFLAADAPPLPTGARPEMKRLDLSAAHERDAIVGFCNRTLWPALHGLAEHVEQSPQWWRSYCELSDLTARRLARELPDGGLIWLQDYHFFGVPAALRHLRPDLTIGVFCHTPIDEPTLDSIAPAARLARRLAGADVIGVQTVADRMALERFFDNRLGDGRRLPMVHAEPVGIDPRSWLDLAADPAVNALAARHRRVHGLLAVGVDRLDYTKGIVHKLLAIESLLDSGALDPDAFRLIQVAVPTRTGVPAYGLLRRQVRELASRINAAHPRHDAIAVVEIVNEQRSPREIAALYRAADLALVTPVRDGMNLVAVEFSVVNHDRGGELVLGKGAGAADSIGPYCTLVDATDVSSIATAILETVRTNGLSAPAGSRGRAALSLTSDRWATACLQLLSAASGTQRVAERAV